MTSTLPDASTTPLRLVASGLTKTFTLHQQGGVRLDVLKGADLDVRAGDCVALAGASGAGKSTLLRCLFGNYGPTTGQVWVNHVDARSLDPTPRWIDVASATARDVREVRRTTMGWVSQFLRVVPRVPAIDIVAEPMLTQRVPPSEAFARAGVLLDRLRVPERLWSLPPATFSGGEQQRVNVARGLAAQHPILLVDEPTASLDKANSDVVVALLNEARENGAAIVGIFHDPAVRAAVATRQVEVADFAPAPSISGDAGRSAELRQAPFQTATNPPTELVGAHHAQ